MDPNHAIGWIPPLQLFIIFDPKKKTNKSTGIERIYNYYHCTNGRQVHSSLKGMSITEEDLWLKLGESLDQITITGLFAKQVSEALNKSHSDAVAATLAEIDRLKMELREIDEMKTRLVDALLNGDIDREEMSLKRNSLNESRDRVLKRYEVAQLSISGRANETAKSILELAINAKSLWNQRSPRERLDMAHLS